MISYYRLPRANNENSQQKNYTEDLVLTNNGVDIQYSPCALGSVRMNTALGTVFHRTIPTTNIGDTSLRGKHCV